MYKQVLDPVSHSLGMSSIFAVLPLVALFMLLGVVRLKAQWASLIALGCRADRRHRRLQHAGRPGVDAGAEGAAFGFFPIMWIVINALWIYHMTVETGHFAVLRRTFSSRLRRQRVQVVVIAFCFGALLEALAGFGTPVAICGVMLVALGFSPIKAAAVALLADTAPVAFGAIAIPSPRWPRSPACPCTSSARWSVARCPLLALLVALPAGDDDRRPSRAAGRLAGRADRGRRVRRAAVCVLELHLDRAHRHRRFAGRRWPRWSR